MKSLLLLPFCLLAWKAPLHAQGFYPVSQIPDSLKKDAHIVFREDIESFTVSSPSKAVYKVHEVITVLDEEGRHRLRFRGYSNSFVSLDDADIYVYDAAGLPTQHIKKKQMEMSGYGENLVDNGMVTYFDVSAPSYPITIEEDYTERYKGTYMFPDFGLDQREESMQRAEFTLTMPKSMTLRYKNYDLNIQPAISDADKDNRTYTWKASNLHAVPHEAGAPSDYWPRVTFGPGQFELAGFAGDMSSWKALGQWGYNLNKEALTLPDGSKDFYRQMVSGATTDLDKARIIYRYLQKNFRYVSIQLGIGGFRSFPAAFTEQKKYGDCKGLSTYMCACLNAVGVRSYTAWINAGDLQQPVDPAFPTDKFNHCILCIPQGKDSVWLECTSPVNEFGVLGAFTENRNALLLTENGGVLANTPKGTVSENTRSFNTRVTLNDDGSGKAIARVESAGDLRFEMLGMYEETHDNQKRFLIEELNFPQPDEFTINLGQVDSPVLKSTMDLNFEKIPDFTAGSKMFLNPRMYQIWARTLPKAEHRTLDYCLPNPLSERDTTCYILPEGYVVDELPKGKTLSCPFGTYTSSYWYDAAQKAVYSSCTFTLKTRRIPAREYAGFKSFCDNVTSDESEKIVINKP